jgi:uncharacterized Zn-binding protein involved in type VI secretion
MPLAARLGDQTAHGGTIGPVVTGIAAKVIIEYMPAACQTDLQVCPLSDGPKPHVGGMIVKGSMTVKIGNKAAARVGDPTECKGPPGTIAKGASTVKIGDMGMGGAGGGGGGSAEDAGTGAVAGADPADVAAQIGSLLAAAAAGMAFCEQCTKQSPLPPPKSTQTPGEKTDSRDGPGSRGRPGSQRGSTPADAEAADAGSDTAPPGTSTATTWVGIELVDSKGKAIPNEPCEIMLPTGEVRKDKLNAQGKLRLDDIAPGTCQVVFPKLEVLRRGKQPPTT